MLVFWTGLVLEEGGDSHTKVFRLVLDVECGRLVLIVKREDFLAGSNEGNQAAAI
jgi:hypothetical protein